jgi:hypothetical protein
MMLFRSGGPSASNARHVLIDDQALCRAALVIPEEFRSRRVCERGKVLGFEQDTQRVADPVVVADDTHGSADVALDVFGRHEPT